MISILFVVPYPELEPVVKEVYERHPKRDSIEVEFKVMTVDEVRTYHLEKEYDVMVGRNFTLKELRKLYPQQAIIDIPITAYDIVRAIHESKELYHAKKIGIIGNFFSEYGPDNLEEVSGCTLVEYSRGLDIDIDVRIQAAKRDGCDCVIGGYSVYQHVVRQHMNGVTIKVGRGTIYNVFDEAIHIAEAVRNEREKTEMFRTVTEKSRNGIFYINSKKELVIVNREAKELFGENIKASEGDRLEDVAPFMMSDAQRVLNGEENRSNRLHHLPDGGMISADYTSVRVGGITSGVVISFQSVIRIQQQESQIRKRLADKGLQAKYSFQDIIYRSGNMEEAIKSAKKYAAVSSNILIIGETGTGKELFAQSIHNASARKKENFVAVNCAALPENLLESELFGYVDGAFTGSKKGGKIGLFELAHKGTLFLDEISEIPLSVQSKLLRVLQEREVRRIGGDHVISVDVRIIAATNRNLKKMVSEGKFRQDLLYRLDVLNVYVPPLRRRPEDVEDLFSYYLEIYADKFGTRTPVMERGALELLKTYDFIGNVRELRNLAERTSVLYEGRAITREMMEHIL
ncbi:MAG: sigma 54-interacting transcriptional regulator, partial [Lachnospiraceae bacterium]|nr:sigma 54-interacting transcriptional regulator [Lachnospiraceae bacterium]